MMKAKLHQLVTDRPIHAGALQQFLPCATMGEICHSVWELQEERKIKVYDETHIIVPTGQVYGDTNEIDALIKEMEETP